MYVAGNSGTQMLLTHQVVYLVDAGVPALTAATVAGTVGLVSIGAKMGWGRRPLRFAPRSMGHNSRVTLYWHGR